MERLFVTVLGNRNSGKSLTWNTLFGATVRTGKNTRKLSLSGNRCVEVFLISGSPEERKTYAGDILADQECRIVLCSVQYADTGLETYDYAFANGFSVFAQWLNPGYHDAGENFNRHGMTPWLLARGATISIRDATRAVHTRAEEIRQFVDGWASSRGLTFPCP
ncbi:hypothetical protein EU803_00525 [Loktanella sp. IMCC34160]|nr:hypothetical protein EU803_00525 [Loktanella sp. IMCC34160]